MIKYSDLYEQFIVILPKDENPKICVINKFDTIEMAQGYEASQKKLKEEERKKREEKEFWWEK